MSWMPHSQQKTSNSPLWKNCGTPWEYMTAEFEKCCMRFIVASIICFVVAVLCKTKTEVKYKNNKVTKGQGELNEMHKLHDKGWML
jgi:hypothetical protein